MYTKRIINEDDEDLDIWLTDNADRTLTMEEAKQLTAEAMAMERLHYPE